MDETIIDRPWALLGGWLEVMHEIAGAEVMARGLGRQAGYTPPVINSAGVAVLPVHGVITHRGLSPLAVLFGGTSTERLGADFQAVIDDDQVKAIVLDINSPGGAVYGLQGLHAQMLEARGRKPVIAAVNSLAASAALWIASAADQIAIAPGGDIGGLGIYLMHRDQSGADRQDGVAHTFISAGRYKTEGNPHRPLADEAKASLQTRVDEAYAAFIGAVATGRRVSTDRVRRAYGQGRLLTAKQAVTVALADRIETFDQTLRRMTAQVAPRAAGSAWLVH